MPDPRSDRLRNVVLVGPAGSGKTTVAEAVLAATGAVNRAGTVADGSTVCDHEPVEKRLRRSVSLACATTEVRDPELTAGGPVRLSLLDTPGNADFVGELRAGLRAADSAIFVVSAVDGIDGATKALWHECVAIGMPRIIALTHVDQHRGDAGAAINACRTAFGDGVQPLYLPTDDGLLGLLSATTSTWSDGNRARRSVVLDADQEAARSALIEGVITESEDEGLLDRYLGGEQVDFDTLVDDLEKAVAGGRFHPVVPVVPTSGLGIPELIEVICRGLPQPVEHVLPSVFSPAGAERPALTGTPDGPLVAEVVKTTTDPYVGRQSLVRVFSGTLRPDAPVHVSGHFSRFTGDDQDEIHHPEHDLDERAGTVGLPVGATSTPVPVAIAGDIVTVSRLAHAETGDTLSDPDDPLVLAPWDIPHPMLPIAIAAASPAEEDRMMIGLGRLQAEDPTLRVQVDRATGQLLLWVLGEQHLEVAIDRLQSRHGVHVVQEEVRVPMVATLSGPTTVLGRHVKQSGGHGQYAVAEVEVEPLPAGSGVEFVDRVVGGTVPRQYIPSVEKGVRHQAESGVDGLPLVDLRVILIGGKAHSVDSSDAAFQTAGALAVREAAAAAGLQVLEPTEDIRVVVDDDHLGAVLSDLSGRRAQVRGTDTADDGRVVITAEVPTVELLRFAVDLRSLARGTGSWTRRPGRHQPAPVRR